MTALLIFALGCGPFAFAQGQNSEAKPEPQLVSQWGAECAEEYEKKVGVRVPSPQEKDRKTCQGKVGESFCLEDKREAFKKDCQRTKQLIWTSEQKRKKKRG